MTWGWVNNDRTFTFGWTNRLCFVYTSTETSIDLKNRYRIIKIRIYWNPGIYIFKPAPVATVWLKCFLAFFDAGLIKSRRLLSFPKLAFCVCVLQVGIYLKIWVSAFTSTIKSGELALCGAFSKGPWGKCTFYSFFAIAHWAVFL